MKEVRVMSVSSRKNHGSHSPMTQGNLEEPINACNAFIWISATHLTSSLWGDHFFLVLVVDFTLMTCIFFLKPKAEAFESFMKFQALVERKSRKNIKIMWSDRGGEFLSLEFNDHCDRVGIQWELTTSYTPQLNGIVERKNWTIVEMTQFLLKGSGLLATFWAKAAAATIYLINVMPTDVVPEKTPYEA